MRRTGSCVAEAARGARGRPAERAAGRARRRGVHPRGVVGGIALAQPGVSRAARSAAASSRCACATAASSWKTYTIPTAAQPTGKTSIGTPTFGPSGVGVWGAPTLDLKRRRLYVTTGNNYSLPGDVDQRRDHGARSRHRPHRLVEAGAAERRLQLGVLDDAEGRDVSGGQRSGLRLRIAGDSGEHDRRPRAAARRTEVRHRLGVRSGQERRGDVADARRPGRDQRRRAVGHGQRRRARLRGVVRCRGHEDGHGAHARSQGRRRTHRARGSPTAARSGAPRRRRARTGRTAVRRSRRR